MQEISSVNNEKIKEIMKLQQKKYRELSGQVLIEGYKIFLEAVKANAEILEILLTKKELEKHNLSAYKDKINLISDNVSKKLSFNQTSQNFFAVIKPREPKVESGSFLILDKIQDPQNLGAIIRTSVACNIKKIFLLDCVDEFNDKVIRASMGNVFKVCFEKTEVENLKEICKKTPVYCADMFGENIFNLKQKPKVFGLILGNEGNGVRSEVKNLASKTISIPMQNNVESLNVAVSMAVIAYNLTN